MVTQIQLLRKIATEFNRKGEVAEIGSLYNSYHLSAQSEYLVLGNWDTMIDQLISLERQELILQIDESIEFGCSQFLIVITTKGIEKLRNIESEETPFCFWMQIQKATQTIISSQSY